MSSGKIYYWRRQWHPTPVLLPGKYHGRRTLVGCSPWSSEESYTTARLHFHFSLPCIGEGNGNPLQCSCLENPSDGGAWWAAVYGVAQSRTRLERLSSSSKIYYCMGITDFNMCRHGKSSKTSQLQNMTAWTLYFLHFVLGKNMYWKINIHSFVDVRKSDKIVTNASVKVIYFYRVTGFVFYNVFERLNLELYY